MSDISLIKGIAERAQRDADDALHLSKRLKDEIAGLETKVNTLEAQVRDLGQYRDIARLGPP